MNLPADHYIPGTCNIGRDEILKRKIELIVSGVATAVLTGLCFFYLNIPSLWLLLFLVSGFTALMYLQVSNRFCVFYGWFKKYNFGKLGNTQKINDPAQVARDRKKVIVIGIQTVVAAFLYTGLIWFLVRFFRF